MKKIISLALSVVVPLILLLAVLLVVHSRVSAQVERVENGVEQVGPPWYDLAWKYRRPINISSTAALSNYQILIRLDNSNFDFSKARADGWDIRFTGVDGTTSLYYWRESWSNGLVYLWVKVPNLNVGQNTIYLYYSNPAASDISNGSATFNFYYDDWSGFIGTGCPSPWVCPRGDPQVLPLGDIYLFNAEIYNSSLYSSNKAMGYRAIIGETAGAMGGFYNPSTGAETVIIDMVSGVSDLTLLNHDGGEAPATLVRYGASGIHHIYEVRWRNGETKGDIDHGSSSAVNSIAVPNGSLNAALYSLWLTNATLQVDWVYVREYSNPEPVVTLGAEQGLVDLQITQSHDPDPVYAGEGLTYQLTVGNTSSIAASGVVVTDTLPAGVTLVNAVPSQGTCDNAVVCSLGTINPGATASVAVNVTTTTAGLITNNAIVGSFSYDSNIINNTSTEPVNVSPSADISVSIVDSPDPVKKNGPLAYTITVLNHGPSMASGVNVVDTLPAGLDVKSASPVSCSQTNPVSCTINSLGVNESVVITIQVDPTAGGSYNNPVNVTSSTTHDPILNNNTDQEATYVDDVLPSAAWVQPVQNEKTFSTPGGVITLEVNAADDYQFDKVEFKYWDHHNNVMIPIGVDTTAPYRAQFNTAGLVGGELYQAFAQAFDRAGNYVRPRIFVEKVYFSYTPIIAVTRR